MQSSRSWTQKMLILGASLLSCSGLACQTHSSPPVAVNPLSIESESTQLASGRVQSGQVVLDTPLPSIYAGEVQIKVTYPSELPNRIQVETATFTKLIDQPGITLYGSDLDSALIDLESLQDFRVTLPEAATITFAYPTNPDSTQLIYQGNPTTVDIEDVALTLATLQVNPKTPEAIVNRANDLLNSPGLIQVAELNPVPTVQNTNYVQGASDPNLGTPDVAAVLARIQVGSNATDIVNRINQLLGAPGLIQVADLAAIPGVNLPGGTSLSSIRGIAWRDANSNGMFDPGESGLSNRVIFLDTNENDSLDPGEQSTFTDTTGAYAFNNLAPGTYVVADVPISGFQQTAPTPGIQTSRRPAEPPAIVGGQPASPGEYPWMAGLLFSDIPDNSAAQFCGGSLIHPDFVLTAAHCLDFLTANNIDVLVGTASLASGGTRIRVAEIIIFPNYQVFFDGSLVRDVALLRLSQSSNASRVEIAPATSGDFVGTLSTAIGWGALSEGGPGPIALQEVDLPVVSNLSCATDLAGIFTILDVMICAGVPQGGIDSCQGDSGGPLLVNVNGRFQVVGLTSFGLGCARPNRPGVYTRVSEFANWINATIGNGAYRVNLSAGESVTNINFGSQFAPSFTP